MTVQPPVPTVFGNVRDHIAAGPGVRLFTVLQWIPEIRTLRRVATSHPHEYPLAAEKTVDVSPSWLGRVIDQRETFFAATRDEVAAVFTDADLISSLGCGAVINVPILAGSRVLGVLAILDAEGSYDQASVAAVEAIVADAAPELSEALSRHHGSSGDTDV